MKRTICFCAIQGMLAQKARQKESFNNAAVDSLPVRSHLKISIAIVLACLLVMGLSARTSAVGFYEFASFTISDLPSHAGLDCGSYGNKIYVHRFDDGSLIDIYTVSVPDINKKDEPPYLPGADGIYGNSDDASNPDYQERTLTLEKTITLKNMGGNVIINLVGHAEIYVDDRGIFITGGPTEFQPFSVLHFDFNGNYQGKAVDASDDGPFPTSLLGYDKAKGIWYGASEERDVWSSTGGEWTEEFKWHNMSGGHGDGMEFVYAPDGRGFLYVSDMTSNDIAQWVKGDDPGTLPEEKWFEMNRFDYVEYGEAKHVEGMGFGALGHFWVTAFGREEGVGGFPVKVAYLYELGGGDLGRYLQSPSQPQIPIPEPSAILLFVIGLIGLLIERKKLL